MKISCDIIKDLLPLYYDGVCSADSKVMIEAHLAQCADCRAELAEMGKELPVSSKEQNLLEAKVVKELSKKWKHLLRKGTEIPTQKSIKEGEVGVIEGAGYQSKGVFRGCENCRMKTNEARAFCPVCQDAIERLILYYTGK